ncbi:hypothetical protein MTR_1g114260 [Medicago truncatula]|uniref:Uncharacterized protein n=1 Tax=Medicago truncatula TaxID=3880 RepID=G7IE82_MEDTR|nr:hypothetical protein MTR_1g114260 [Medicago truncatula]
MKKNKPSIQAGGLSFLPFPFPLPFYLKASPPLQTRKPSLMQLLLPSMEQKHAKCVNHFARNFHSNHLVAFLEV